MLTMLAWTLGALALAWVAWLLIAHTFLKRFIGLTYLIRELRKRDVDPQAIGLKALREIVTSSFYIAKADALTRMYPFNVGYTRALESAAQGIAEVLKGRRNVNAQIWPDGVLIRCGVFSESGANR